VEGELGLFWENHLSHHDSESNSQP